MDLRKIGSFLKELRKEKDLTQEQLAETLNVSRRTVSRWETGANLPDMDLLIEMADLYEVDLRELLNGERKNGKMNEEMKQTVLQVAEYENAAKQRVTKVVRILFVLGIAALIVNVGMDIHGVEWTFWTGYLKGVTYGVALGAMIVGLCYTTGVMKKIREFKLRMLGRNIEE